MGVLKALAAAGADVWLWKPTVRPRWHIIKTGTQWYLKSESLKAVHLAKLLCVLAGICTRRVHEGEDGKAELVSVAHEAQRLAVAVGLWHAEVAVNVLLQQIPVPGNESITPHTIRSSRDSERACACTPWVNHKSLLACCGAGAISSCNRPGNSSQHDAVTLVLRPFWWPIIM